MENIMDWDFSANQEIDETVLNTAPEGFRSAYVQGDNGKFRIADTHKPFVEAITGLGTALRAERGTSKELKGKKDIGAVIKEQLGFDTVEEAKAKFEELSTAIATASKVDPAKIKADIQKTFDALSAEKDGQITKMQSTLNRYMVESAAISALAAAKGNAKLLMPMIREQVELVADNDDYVVRVKDGAGDYRGNGKGGFMSVEDLVAEMKASKDFAGGFESDQPGGADTRQGQRPGTHQRQQMRSDRQKADMTPADRIAAGLEARRRNR
jgi:hypothetical protein